MELIVKLLFSPSTNSFSSHLQLGQSFLLRNAEHLPQFLVGFALDAFGSLSQTSKCYVALARILFRQCCKVHLTHCFLDRLTMFDLDRFQLLLFSILQFDLFSNFLHL